MIQNCHFQSYQICKTIGIADLRRLRQKHVVFQSYNFLLTLPSYWSLFLTILPSQVRISKFKFGCNQGWVIICKLKIFHFIVYNFDENKPSALPDVTINHQKVSNLAFFEIFKLKSLNSLPQPNNLLKMWRTKSRCVSKSSIKTFISLMISFYIHILWSGGILENWFRSSCRACVQACAQGVFTCLKRKKKHI